MYLIEGTTVKSGEIFKVGDGDLGGDSVEAYCYGGKITIEIDEPWAGDTETGIGRTCSIGLSLDKAEELANWPLAAVHREKSAS